MRRLKKGDRIRLKVPLFSGWKGTGTVVAADDDLVQFRKDGSDPQDEMENLCLAMREQVAILRAPRLKP